MSYSDQQKSFSPASLGTVVVLHVAIGYALISGLAYRVVHQGPLVTTAQLLPDDPVPPPKLMPPPPTQPTTTRVPLPERPNVEVPLAASDTTIAEPLPPVRSEQSDASSIPVQSTIVPSLARVALPEGNKAEWVTADDYPAAALRDGVEGLVGIDVTIDAKGRVSGCSILMSSGNELLDQATCRTYARRARFRAALNENGQPTVTHRTDRIRWQIPH